MIKLRIKYLLCIFVVIAFIGLQAIANQDKPVLRGSIPSQMRLEGDIAFTKSNPYITLSLRDSDVQQVLRMFADKAGLNIIFHDSVTKDKKITMDLVNVPLNNAFKMVMQVTNLTYYIDGRTMIVATAESAKTLNYSKHVMTAIPIKNLDASVIAQFLNKNIFSQNLSGLSTGDICTTNPLENELLIFGTRNDVLMAQKIIDKFDKKPKTTTFITNHVTPKEMSDMICKLLFPSTFGTGGTGGLGASSGSTISTPSTPVSTPAPASITPSFSPSSSNNSPTMTPSSTSSSGTTHSGSATGFASGMSLGEGIIACTLKESVQTTAFSSFPTPSLTVAYFPQIGTINVIGGNASQLKTISEFIKEHDKKQLQAYLEMAIVETKENGSKELTNTWTLASRNVSVSATKGSLETTVPIYLLGSASSVLRPNETTISWAIKYLMANSKGRMLSNPRILITNGQPSTLDLTSDYVKKITQTAATTTTGNMIPVSRNYEIGSDKGLKFEITPFISPEGYVTFDIAPNYTTTSGTVGEGNEKMTLLSRRNLSLKGIRVKDGETLIIGGLVQENEDKGVSKIPVLGDIPLLGFLFRSSAVTRDKSELVIMLTPRILFDDEDMKTYGKGKYRANTL